MGITPADVKRRLLKEAGVTTTKEVGRHRKLKPTTKPSTGGPRKTPLMRYIEQKTGRTVEDLLLSGSLNHVAGICNKGEAQPIVERTTLSKWIKKLRLRYTKDNLPDCNNCGHYKPACDMGICTQLMELGLYDLIEYKKKEILG